MTESWPAGGTSADDTLLTVLELVRSHGVRTRPELVRASGLGRNVVTARLQQLLDAGLVAEGTLGRSTGGRAPRELAFRHDAGHVLVAALGATGASIALAELGGHLVEQRRLALDVTCGPDRVLEEVDIHFRSLRERFPNLPVWGVGVGVPGPVEWSSGRPVAPPIMPGWDGFDIRGFFESRHQAPVWVDNDVNLMAIGEGRCGTAQGAHDFVNIKVGTGIGAGIVSGDRLHRG
ncbi:MAG: ROK family protein, partial [Ornithinimicrobium sp.]